MRHTRSGVRPAYVDDVDALDEDEDIPLVERIGSTDRGSLAPTTYTPNRLEADWLLQALNHWFEDGTLTDILFAVGGGKEANVYCCRGGPIVDGALVAAKVYRPRKLRELRNDALYREGRSLLDAEGHARKARDQRIARAVRRGTRFGKQASHTSWVHHERLALWALHEAGGTVPAPIAAGDNAVLTAFVGDEEGAAPTMDRMGPPRERAQSLLSEILADVEILLGLGLVHGDLSPYNLMYWQDRAVMIDFPQVVDVFRNPHAPRLFRRDVARVCRGLGRYGAEMDAEEAADDVWDRVFDTVEGVPEGPIAHVR